MVCQRRHPGQAVGSRFHSGQAQRLRHCQARQPADPGRSAAARRRRPAEAAHARLGQGRGTARHRTQQGAAGWLGWRGRIGQCRQAGQGLPVFGRLLLMGNGGTQSRKYRLQGAGLDLALPYLMLAPSLLIVLGVLVYPLWDGLRASTKVYRYGSVVADVGTHNYIQLWSDPQFLNSLWVTVEFVALSVTFEAILGFALALFCLREFRGIRLLRTILIIPMVITPVVVAIVFRLIYASDAGMLTAISEWTGGGQVQILGSPVKAFIGLVVLDVWEWTPLMFLILLAGLQSLPHEPFEAARVDGAGNWRVFADLTFPMMRPVLAIAIVLRTIDAFGTFDQVFVLTRGGPGEATRLVSIYGYDTAFKFQQTGYAAALFVTIGLVVLALAFSAVRLLRRVDAS
ncbi:sugar ABC transporter permease [Mesorhizobium sp. B2-3-11]|nr:sugar ABC transporter permease [Mesorhizobium sp. B2-3-11]